MANTTRTPVFNRYEVLEKIGSGGMGAVYKARDIHLDRWVALKVLPPGMQEDAELLERFRREARALARLKHPGVAAVYDANVEGGFPYLVMEFVEGENLEKVLRERKRLSIDEVVRLGIELAEALDHIHHYRILHRDIKTANIIIGPKGQAVLADFGIAFVASLPRISKGTLGTPEYMSPEQADGKPMDGRTDLYSLGVVLFECLTGQVPFYREGESLGELAELLTNILETPAPSCTTRRDDIPSWLAEVVGRCLAKEPGDRFATGGDLALALRKGGEDIRERHPRRRRPKGVKKSSSAEGPKDSEAPKPEARKEAEGKGITLISHVEPVVGVVCSPDGSRLASASADRAVRIWAVASGQLLHTLSGHRDNVLSISFSPDGLYLASGDVAGVIRIWDAMTGQLRRTLEGHTALVMSVAFSPDGNRLVSGGADGMVRVWDREQARWVHLLGGHVGYVLSVSFSPDGRRLVSGGADGAIRLWEAATGKLLRTLGGHTAWVVSVSFSPDGRRLVSGGADGTIRLWDAPTGEQLRTLGGHGAWIMSVSFSPDGQYLVSACRDHTVRIWAAEKGRLLRKLKGHTGPVMAAAFSPDGKYLVSGSRDRTIRLWPLDHERLAKQSPLRRFLGLALVLILVMLSWWGNKEDGLDRAPTSTPEVTQASIENPRPILRQRLAPVMPPRPRLEARPDRIDLSFPIPEEPKPLRSTRTPLHSDDGLVLDEDGWTLVVAFEKRRHPAEQLADSFRTEGFRAGVLVRVFTEGISYQVGVGQFRDRTEAARARRRLAGHELPYDTWVMRIRQDLVP